MKQASLTLLIVVTVLISVVIGSKYFSPKSWEQAQAGAPNFQKSTALEFHSQDLILSNKKKSLHQSITSSAKTLAEESEQVPRPSNSVNRDEIENEFTVNFDSPEKLDQFLKLAREIGISILDKIDILNAVRIKAKDINQFNDLISQGPTPNDYASNYYIRTPNFPKPPDNLPQLAPRELEPFGDKALEWLGLDGDQKYRGENVLIAILDTGVFNHSALNMKRIEQISLLDDSNAEDSDYNGHGTAVASIISGDSPDTPGIAPGAEILSVQVLDSKGVGDTFTVAKGIVEAVDRGTDIINLSLGAYGDSPALRQAIEYAHANGVAVVASVGNDGIVGITYPARYPEVIATTGVDPAGQHVYFANQGPQVDIAAPATGVSAAWTDDNIVSFSGTSAAAPFVSGAVALVMDKDPSLTATEAAEIVLENSNDSGPPGPDPIHGNGSLSVDGSLTWDVAGRYDIALASHHFEQTSANDLELVVTAQNRGTEPLSKIHLTLKIDGLVKHFEFENVGVRETVSTPFLLDEDKLSKAQQMDLSSSVSIIGRNDIKPDNNNKSSRIKYIESPSR